MGTDAAGEERTSARGRPRSRGADEAILRATVELIAERGVDAVTIDGVARRSGVARATIYLRWSTRDALIAGAVWHAMGRRPLRLTGDIESDIHGATDMARSVFSQPLLRTVFPAVVRQLLAEGDPGAGITYDTLFPSFRGFVDSYGVHALEQGFRTDIDGSVVADLVVGAFVNEFLATGKGPAAAFARQVADTVIAGIRLPASD